MRVFSGIQPTGILHIGNYLGAIKQWVEIQKDNECFFCIVDLHALTVPYDPKKLNEYIMEKAIVYLAAGIDPNKSVIFVQSQVKEHAELAWLLNTVTSLGDLSRMTQFKDKSKKYKKDVTAGLFNYPILMAADILLYKADLVPVGEDQKQHVELTRTIARKFNLKYGDLFNIPESKVPKIGARIMSLQEPTKKMSKSDPEETYIGIFDEPEVIKKKIMRAVTDTGKKIEYNVKSKPGVSNLLTIHSLFSNKPVKQLELEFKGKGYAEFKRSLADLLIESLEPFRKKRKELIQREIYVKEILEQGRKRAQLVAQSTMQEVKKKMGL